MSDTATPPPPATIPKATDAATPEAHAVNCWKCGLPEYPCPRCGPKPEEKK